MTGLDGGASTIPAHLVGPGTLRLDKWLVHARFFRTRGLATRFVDAGRLRVDGVVVSKAHFALRPGMVLTFPLGAAIRVIRVEAMGVRRGPAPEARLLYTDLQPLPAPGADSTDDARDDGAGRRDPGAGRPTKRERRAIDKLRSDG
ncbi:MAG: RNA-binding S4 domain-containing protein [Alphaproteobacteria bacterium]|nr:RNA-binding S4 domain-containing protein [Alphaproteobacteria bacterium]